MFRCRVIADTIYKTRLTTVEITYPRFIHSEIMTHRDRARNAGSSRAIPWPTMLKNISDDPVIPLAWGQNQKGMQMGTDVDVETAKKARNIWLSACQKAMNYANMLHELGIHKSLVNRIVEPWMWITVIMSSTRWNNFFEQRCDPEAEIHFQKIASMIRDALNESKPSEVEEGGWHLPFIETDDVVEANDKYGKTTLNVLCKVSSARCARVSYIQHGEKKKDLVKDLDLAEKLIKGQGERGHRSPFEHVAYAYHDSDYRSGPFIGWRQYRKILWSGEE